ncbi:hypothetical protein KSD_01730 [Ktedonobacter sp. SOSP1-85]|uniref:EndoU domain-containing protein n=1 Tax=Ktedonobacter sp. SOSP1-85 TaxID=2778367 RepID=UPI0019159993|nr:EndoU domain-containing protein [Ktedonobacter sp. SOSP1-85]GHO72402.1 hypothetical protein KSD_01730 [Ktedonobacter sp. SOSP1-85]
MTTIEHAKHELESINLPNAEIFRELASHLQNWASQHEEYLRLLDTGHGNLKDSWEGDGAQAYTLLHTRSQEAGNAHLEHFQEATQALTKTATLVEDAHEKKSNAWKWILGLGLAAVITAGIALFGIPAVIAGVMEAITAATTFFSNIFGKLAVWALGGIIAWMGGTKPKPIPIPPPIPIPLPIPTPQAIPVSTGSLANTGNFLTGALDHIFFGDVKTRKGKSIFGGFHYAAANALGKIVKVISTNPDGVFTAQVNGPGGLPKNGNGGISTFFPTSMGPQDVVDAINTAYSNAYPSGFVAGSKNTYEYTFTSGPYTGMVIDMYINAAGKIISAFPVR